MFGYIYKITNNINGKIYIGKRESNKFKENYWGSGKLIKQAIAKYGKDNFSRDVLQWCETKPELYEAEKYWIRVYNARNRDIGYNIAEGGEKGSGPHTEEWKLQHSGKGNGMYGRHHSEETKKLIANSKIGMHFSEEVNSKKGRPGVKKPDGFGEKIRKANLGKHLSEDTKLKIGEKSSGRSHKLSNESKKKISDSNIGKHNMQGELNPMYGRHHSDEAKAKMSASKSGKRQPALYKKVECLETGKIYACVTDAEKETGLTTIGRCCRGVIKEVRKNHTHWRFIYED